MALSKIMADWFESMPEAELDTYEAGLAEYKGADLADYQEAIANRREMIALEKYAKEHPEEVEAARKEEEASRVYDLEKLEPYKMVPRKLDSEFVQAIAGKPSSSLFGLFGNKKETEKIANAPIVYAAVVQANDVLWEPKGDTMYAPAVVVFTEDKFRTYDKEWLREIAKTLENFRDTATVPEDCKKIVMDLRNPKSSFCRRVGSSVTGGATTVWCADIMIPSQPDLPFGCLPSDRILPMLLSGEVKENYSAPLRQIPGKFYA